MAVPKIWRKIPEYYNLIGRHCPDCKELYFPVREVCKKCGCLKMEEHKFEGKGNIVTFTITRTPMSDPEGENTEVPARDVPYAVAIIKLEEGPMLTAEIVDCDFDDIEIGKNVEVVFRKIIEFGTKGVIQYGYKFRLV